MAIYKRGTIWYIDHYCHGRRVRERIGSSKRAAEQALAVQKAEILQGRYHLNSKKKAVRFKELTVQYIEHAKTTKLSWRRDVDFVKHLLAFFKDRPLNQITQELVEQYKAHRRKEILARHKYADKDPRTVPMSTINRELSCLRRIFNLAISWDKAERNPVKGVRFFREESLPARILKDDEIELLLLCCNRITADVVQLALNTGMRRGEILNLRWAQVDLTEGYITVIKTKSGRQRQIPINETAHNLLKRRPRNGAFVFHRNGKPAKSVRTTYEQSVKRAAIGHCRFHDLRHTFATNLVLRGVPLPVVKELLGHSTISTTMRYAHPTPESKRNAVALLDRSADLTRELHIESIPA
jgi:integrase